MRAYISLFAAALPLTTVQAQERDEHEDGAAGTETLFLMDTAFVQERGRFQASLQGSFLTSPAERSGQTGVEIEYGITDRLQAALELPLAWNDSEEEEGNASGLGDIEAGLLWRVTEAGAPITFSLGAEVAFPTGDEDQELGEGEFVFGPAASVAARLGRVVLHGSAGFEISDEDESPFFGLAAELPVDDFSLITELTWEGDRDAEVYLTPGVSWRFAEDWAAGVGTPIGLTDDSREWGLAAFITLEF